MYIHVYISISTNLPLLKPSLLHESDEVTLLMKKGHSSLENQQTSFSWNQEIAPSLFACSR